MILNSRRHKQSDRQSCRVWSLAGRRGAQTETTHQETKRNWAVRRQIMKKRSTVKANAEKGMGYVYRYYQSWVSQAISLMPVSSCILDSCTIAASYEVSQAQKALLLMPRTARVASTSSGELNTQVCHCQQMISRPSQSRPAPRTLSALESREHHTSHKKVTFKHWCTPHFVWCWKSTTERTLRALSDLV